MYLLTCAPLSFMNFLVSAATSATSERHADIYIIHALQNTSKATQHPKLHNTSTQLHRTTSKFSCEHTSLRSQRLFSFRNTRKNVTPYWIKSRAPRIFAYSESYSSAPVFKAVPIMTQSLFNLPTALNMIHNWVQIDYSYYTLPSTVYKCACLIG